MVGIQGVLERMAEASHGVLGLREIRLTLCPLMNPQSLGTFVSKSPKQTPHSSPVRARYEMPFVSSMSVLCSAVVIVVLYVIPWYIQPCYNSTRLYQDINKHTYVGSRICLCPDIWKNRSWSDTFDLANLGDGNPKGVSHQQGCANGLFQRPVVQWRHNGRDGVSNHRRLDDLRNRLFRRRSNKKHQSSASLAFVRGIHRWPVNSPHKGPATR